MSAGCLKCATLRHTASCFAAAPSPQNFADQLIAALNNAPQFDFDYTPAEGDVLNVKPGAGSLHNMIELEFTAGQWRQQNQDSNHLNRKLTIGSGVIKPL